MRHENLDDDKSRENVTVSIANLNDIRDPRLETPDGELHWRGDVNYALYIGMVARVGKERELVLFPLSRNSPVASQQRSLHSAARRAGLEIRTRRWGDDLIIWRADYPIKFEPEEYQDYERRRQLRKFSGLTQLETARRAGINHSVLCKFELGYERLSVEKLKRLDQVLKEAVVRVPDVRQLISELDD